MLEKNQRPLSGVAGEVSMLTGAFIGQGSMVQACAEDWLAAGHRILVACSPDGSLESWCRRHSVPHIKIVAELERLLAGEVALDVLWSINNPVILGATLLSVPERYTINFHDSPLPRYAGLFATSWAIANGEQTHAVTFHIVEPGIDTGDVLKQCAVDLAAHETAETLNLKCFQAAGEAYRELVGELATGDEKAEPQPLSERTYFGHGDRPSPACVLDFNQPVPVLDAWVRALTLGASENPVGRPTLVIQGQMGRPHILSVGKLVAVAGTAGASTAALNASPNGRVLAADAATRELRFMVDGQILVLSDVHPWDSTDEFPVAGDVALSPGQLGEKALNALCKAASASEARWVRRYNASGSTGHPRLRTAKVSTDADSTDTRDGRAASSQSSTDAPLCLQIEGEGTTRQWLSRLVAFFARCNDDGIGHVQLYGVQSPYWQADGNVGPVESSVEALSDGQAGDPARLPGLFLARRVPLTLALADDDTFEHVVQRVERFMRSARKSGPPFADLSARYADVSPLASGGDAVWVCVGEREPADEANWPGLVVHIRPDGCVRFILNACQDEEDARALVREFEVFCAEIESQGPAAKVSDVGLLHPEMREKILGAWNRTDKVRSAPMTVCGSFALAVADHGQEVAMIDPNTGSEGAEVYSLSYAELDALSTAVARALMSHGVVMGDLVGVAIERSAAQLVTVLGILKSGAAYLPLDPAYPVERNLQIVELAKPKCIVEGDYNSVPTQEARAGAGNGGPGTETLAYGALLAEGEPLSTPLPAVSASDLAYVIFTSGSTGRPKGVPIQHGALLNHARAFMERLELAPGDRALQSASLSFDVAGEQIFPALFSGAALVLRTPDLLESFAGFSDFFTHHRISMAVIPTGYWQEWVAFLDRTGTEVPPSLRFLATGTEKVQGWALTQWRHLAPPNCRWFQGYGPTEATITCLLHEDDGSAVPSRGVPIGRPLPNVQAYVVDRKLRPVPLGWPGELLIAGAGLSPGYLHDTRATEKGFCEVDHLGQPGLRVYRTGDLVVQDSTGALTFLGRRDNQVKVAGYRIELGEIEARISELDVVDAVAVVLSGKGATAQLIAHVGSHLEESLLASKVLTYVQDGLPAFMVPSLVMQHAQLPVLANGKIDRRSLEAMTVRRAGATSGESAQPKKSDTLRPSSLEFALAELWKSTLSVSVVRGEDDFFELGGTSLAAVRLCSDIEQEMKTAFSLSQVFTHRTLREMAVCLEAELEQPERGASRRSARPAGFASELAELAGVVPLQKDGDGLPLFLVCGIELYRDLAGQLGSRQPTFGVFLPFEAELALRLDNGETDVAFPGVVELAASYVRGIRAQQPCGPYRIGGVSFGGVLAYEAAQQLKREGEEVDMLLLIETFLPSAWRFSRGRWVAEHMASLGDRSMADAVKRGIGFSKSKLASIKSASIKLASRRLTSRVPSGASSDDFMEALVQGDKNGFAAMRMRVYHDAAHAYAPSIQPYDGNVVLIRATQQPWMPGYQLDPTYGWGAWIRGRLSTHDVKGDHLSVLRQPQVSMLASALIPYLSDDRG